MNGDLHNPQVGKANQYSLSNNYACLQRLQISELSHAGFEPVKTQDINHTNDCNIEIDQSYGLDSAILYTPRQIALQKHFNMVDEVWPDITKAASAEFPKFAKLFTDIKMTGVPNFIGAKIQLHSDLVVEQWEAALQAYHDKEICEFLKFGWPIGFLADQPPVSQLENHPSAKQHERHISKFIDTELQHNAIVGPFSEAPFYPWTRCSPS